MTLRSTDLPPIPADWRVSSQVDDAESSDFVSELDHTLRALSRVRVPMTLYVVHTLCTPHRIALASAKSALERLGPVGSLAEGVIGFLFIGPRTPNHRSRGNFGDVIARRLCSAMRDHSVDGAACAVALAALNLWSDEVVGVESLASDLMQLMQPRFHAGRKPMAHLAHMGDECWFPYTQSEFQSV